MLVNRTRAQRKLKHFISLCKGPRVICPRLVDQRSNEVSPQPRVVNPAREFASSVDVDTGLCPHPCVPGVFNALSERRGPKRTSAHCQVVAWAVPCVMLLCPWYAWAQTCTTFAAQHAEATASTLSTWQAVYLPYQRYHQCDDGAIAEGYSYTVARLLTADWRGIGQLVQITNSNPSFEDFVFKHVDGLMSSKQASAIFHKARSHCPSSAARLCRRLMTAIREAG